MINNLLSTWLCCNNSVLIMSFSLQLSFHLNIIYEWAETCSTHCYRQSEKEQSFSFSLKYGSNTNTWLSAHKNYWRVSRLTDGQLTDTNTASTITPFIMLFGVHFIKQNITITLVIIIHRELVTVNSSSTIASTISKIDSNVLSKFRFDVSNNQPCCKL